MTNIVVERPELVLDNKSLSLYIKTSKLRVTCSNKNEITILEYPDKLNLSFYLLPDSSLVINQFKINAKNNKLNIKINQEKNSNLDYRLVLVAHEKLNVNISNTIHGDNNHSQITIRCLAEEKGQALIQVDGVVLSKIKDNSLQEDARILTLNDKEHTIVPNLLIASNEIVAIHNATIGGVNPEDLFYLKSKGLSEDKSINLIKNGFLINGLKLNDNVITKIKEELIEMDGGI